MYGIIDRVCKAQKSTYRGVAKTASLFKPSNETSSTHEVNTGLLQRTTTPDQRHGCPRLQANLQKPHPNRKREEAPSVSDSLEKQRKDHNRQQLFLSLALVSDGVAVEDERGDQLREDIPASDFYLKSCMTRTIEEPFVHCDESVVSIIALRTKFSSIIVSAEDSTHPKSSGAWSPLVLVPVYGDEVPRPSSR